MDTPESRTGLTKLSKGLGTLLERVQNLRSKIPPEERNPPSRLAVRDGSGHLAKTRPTITKEALARLLGPLETIYGSQSIGRSGQAVKYQIFYDVLRQCTELEVRAAVERYLRKTDPPHQFFPKPAELLALAKD